MERFNICIHKCPSHPLANSILLHSSVLGSVSLHSRRTTAATPSSLSRVEDFHRAFLHYIEQADEVVKNALCNGNCDEGSCVCIPSCSSSSCSSDSSQPSVASSIYMELWHACAGPLTSLPNKGNVVVYFPQGHLEQSVSSATNFPPMDLPNCEIHPQIFCRVVKVQLLANKENDEVYAKLALLPLPPGWVGMNSEPSTKATRKNSASSSSMGSRSATTFKS